LLEDAHPEGHAKRPRLLVTSRQLAAMAQPPEHEFELLYLEDRNDPDGWLRTMGQGVEVVLASGMERFDAARLDLLPDLKLISVCAAGVGGIELEAARIRGVAVTNAGDINAGDVADYAIAMALAHVRELVANDAYVRADRWPDARRPLAPSMSAKRVGIVGLGHIGRAIATRMTPFGCPVAWWGRRPQPELQWPMIDSLAELAAWSDILCVAVAGNATTRGLITADIIARLGPAGLLVNVSRGFVVDEAALRAALKAGELGGAALDVFEKEPILGSDWADVPNVLMAPHVGGATSEAVAKAMAGALDNVRRCLAGQELSRRVV